MYLPKFILNMFSIWLVIILAYIGAVEVFTWIAIIFNKSINPGFWFWFISIIIVSILFWLFYVLSIITSG